MCLRASGELSYSEEQCMKREQVAWDTWKGVKTVKLPFIYSKAVLLPITFDTPCAYWPQESVYFSCKSCKKSCSCTEKQYSCSNCAAPVTEEVQSSSRRSVRLLPGNVWAKVAYGKGKSSVGCILLNCCLDSFFFFCPFFSDNIFQKIWCLVLKWWGDNICKSSA